MTSLTVSRARKPSFIVRPASRWVLPDLKELWNFRDLLVVLAWRDLKVRYSQALLGVVWVVLQPLLGAAILAVIFGRVIGVSTAKPYLAVVFSGFVLWTFFSSAVQRASTSIVLDAKLITRVYFPRLVIPLASVVAALADLLIGLVVLAAIMAFHGLIPDWRVATFPFVLLWGIAMAVGVGVWLAALNVRYRDFMYAAPFLLQVWLYASPVVYETSVIPRAWRLTYALNPVVGWIDACRWALLGDKIEPAILYVSAAVTIAVLVTGILFFNTTERGMADVI